MTPAKPLLCITWWSTVTVSFAQTFPWAQYIGNQCQKLDVCSCKLQGSDYIISLWKINNNTSPLFGTVKDSNNPSLHYLYNPCTPFDLPVKSKDINCTDAIGCQVNEVNGSVYFKRVIANPHHVEMLFNAALKRYVFSYIGVEQEDDKAKTYIALECDPKQDVPVFKNGIHHSADFTFTGTLTSKWACPGLGVSPVLAKRWSKTISIGAILCISLSVFIAVFLVIGTAVNYFGRQKRGLRAVPFGSFFMDMFYNRRGYEMVDGYIRVNDHDDRVMISPLLAESRA